MAITAHLADARGGLAVRAGRPLLFRGSVALDLRAG
jgi:hypothetical protein